MTKHDLKELAAMGAELGAAKAEVERLRVLLRDVNDVFEGQHPAPGLVIARVRNTLSQQAEPVRSPGTEDSASMDSDVRQEPAPAQDEREAELWAVHAQGPDDLYAAFSREDAEQHAAALNALPMPEGIRVSAVVVPSPWSAAEHWKYAAELERDHATDLKAIATRPAQTEQQSAYVECRECTDCGHVGINDAHPTDATCAMCDWSGPSPVEDQCPDCGKENAMGAACPKCSGRYRILAETHVAAPIAQTTQRGEA